MEISPWPSLLITHTGITIYPDSGKLTVNRQLQVPSKLNFKLNEWHKYINYAVIGPKVSAILGIGFCIGLKPK